MIQRFGKQIGSKLRHFGRFLPAPPVVSPLKINDRLLPYFHGMEEVVGSIPTRSTNPN